MTMPQRGWKKRQNAAAKRFETDTELEAVRAQRADLAAAAVSCAQAEYDLRMAKLAESQCTCPVCDSGAISLELAERVIRAMARLPVHMPLDETVMMALRRIAFGHDVSTLAFPESDVLKKPRRVARNVTSKSIKVMLNQDAVVSKPSQKLTSSELYAATEFGILDLNE